MNKMMESKMNDQQANDSEPLEAADVLKELVLAMVSRPESVKVEESFDGQKRQLTIWADRADYGQLIGSHGKTMAAIRACFAVIGYNYGETIAIDVAEEARQRRVA